MRLLADYRIITPADPVPGETRAALFLQNAIRIVVGAMLPILPDTEAPTACELAVGRTNRLGLDGLNIPAYLDGRDEFTLRLVGERLHFCGHGIPEQEPFPAVSAYRYYDDGSFGTVSAVYRFVEDVLKYPFLHAVQAPVNPSAAIPEDYCGDYTRELLRACPVPAVQGTALYMLPVTGLLNWNIMSFILRTREGKLVVIDGGHAQEKDYLLSVLRALSPDPDHIRVEAWLITHLHGDHFRALRTLLQDEKTAEFLEIGDVYLNLLEDRFYTELSPERIGEAPAVRHDLMNLPQRLGARVHIVNDDDSFTVDELTFRALHVPKMADAKLMDTNDSSVVWQMRVEGGQTVLFLSDAEFVCNNDLLTRCRADLPADIVQIGHHGCGNVSGECYRAIGAKTYLWQIGHKFWFSDRGDGLGTHNTGVIHTRACLDAMGIPPTSHIRDDHGIVGISLEYEVHHA